MEDHGLPWAVGLVFGIPGYLSVFYFWYIFEQKRRELNINQIIAIPAIFTFLFQFLDGSVLLIFLFVYNVGSELSLSACAPLMRVHLVFYVLSRYSLFCFYIVRIYRVLRGVPGFSKFRTFLRYIWIAFIFCYVAQMSMFHPTASRIEDDGGDVCLWDVEKWAIAVAYMPDVLLNVLCVVIYVVVLREVHRTWFDIHREKNFGIMWTIGHSSLISACQCCVVMVEMGMQIIEPNHKRFILVWVNFATVGFCMITMFRQKPERRRSFGKDIEMTEKSSCESDRDYAEIKLGTDADEFEQEL